MVVRCNVQKTVVLTYLIFQVDKVVGEMEQKCDQKVAECREELRQQLLRIQEENATLVWHWKLVQT